jgi:hypothetical protein
MNESAETLEYRGNSVITTEPPKALQLCVAENPEFAHPFDLQFSVKGLDD